MVATPISGSYAPDDCQFLLTPITPDDMPIADKERLIQSGERHYSEMITHEHPVHPDYAALFESLTQRYRQRLAQQILDLAAHLLVVRPQPLVLVSLARAGTPIGALLRRAVMQLGGEAVHYSLSIIRDRGIDQRALRFLLEEKGYPATNLAFIDGWTAKGVIGAELQQAIAAWNQRHSQTLAPELFVIADLSGTATAAATYDDYAIPSGILGATVSGLISRSILNEVITADDFHGCVIYHGLQDQDYSCWFLDTISAALPLLQPRTLAPEGRVAQAERTQAFLERIRRRFNIKDINHIKPGALEATRVMLRRVPGALWLRDDSTDTAHLRLLAVEKGVPVHYDATMPFSATALIKTVGQDSPKYL